MKIKLKRSFWLLFFSILTFSFLASACQLKKRGGEDDGSASSNTNQSKSDSDSSDSSEKEKLQIAPGYVLLGNVSFDRYGEETSDFEKVKNKVESAILKNPSVGLLEYQSTFQYKYSPVLDKFLVGVRNADYPTKSGAKSFVALFLVDSDGENLTPIKIVDDKSFSYIVSPTFSADGRSEIGWIEKDEKIEKYAVRVHIYNISNSREMIYKIEEPSVIFDESVLAFWNDKIIFKTDRLTNPFKNTFLTYAARSSFDEVNILKPSPFTFISEVKEALQTDANLDFVGILTSISRSGVVKVYYIIRETVIDSETRTNQNKLLIVEQSGVGNLRVVMELEFDTAIFSSQVSFDSKVPVILKDKGGVYLKSIDLLGRNQMEIASGKAIETSIMEPTWWKKNS